MTRRRPGRPRRIEYAPTYRVFIYRPHQSGVGTTLVKEITVTVKPSYDNCDFLDETNRVFSCWEHSEKAQSFAERTVSTWTIRR